MRVSITLVLAGLLVATAVTAQEMRTLKVIPSRGEALKNAPEGAELPKEFERVPRGDVKSATEELAEDWSKGDLSGQIGEDLYDGQRLAQNMGIRVPQDANLRVEGVRSVQTDNQFIMRGEDGGRIRVSTVTATVQTVSTANDPARGVVRVPGLNRLTFQVTERLD